MGVIAVWKYNNNDAEGGVCPNLGGAGEAAVVWLDVGRPLARSFKTFTSFYVTGIQ